MNGTDSAGKDSAGKDSAGKDSAGKDSTGTGTAGADGVAAHFEEQRDHLRMVAYRMLGSLSEADDAVQEAWLRLHRAGTDDIRDLRAWLTTVVSRVCLDMLRSRATRREDSLDTHVPDPIVTRIDEDPAEQAALADSVGIALLVVLDRLSPAERLAFVLHDIFALPFEQIGPILDRSPAAAKQLASRARRRLRSSGPPVPGQDGTDSGRTGSGGAHSGGADSNRADSNRADPNRADPMRAGLNRADPNRADPDGADPDGADPNHADPDGADPDGADPDRADAESWTFASSTSLPQQWAVVDAFLAAARDGDFEGLLAILDPDVVLRGDAGLGPLGPSKVVRGAREAIAHAQRYAALGRFARPVLVNGGPGLLVAPAGEPLALMAVTVRGNRIVELDILADPDRLATLNLPKVDPGAP